MNSSKNITPTAIRKLITLIKKQGYLMAVWSEGDCLVGKTDKAKEVFDGVDAVEESVITIYTKEGVKIGRFCIVLVYNEPAIISDYSDKDECHEIANQFDQWLDNL